MQDILDMTVPIVVETSGRTERAYDIFSRLLKDRIVLLGSEVNDAVASLICAQLLFLESQDPEKEIYLYINSPGGSVTAGMLHWCVPADAHQIPPARPGPAR